MSEYKQGSFTDWGRYKIPTFGIFARKPAPRAEVDKLIALGDIIENAGILGDYTNNPETDIVPGYITTGVADPIPTVKVTPATSKKTSQKEYPKVESTTSKAVLDWLNEDVDNAEKEYFKNHGADANGVVGIPPAQYQASDAEDVLGGLRTSNQYAIADTAKALLQSGAARRSGGISRGRSLLALDALGPIADTFYSTSWWTPTRTQDSIPTSRYSTDSYSPGELLKTMGWKL
jgi:hypothetical protein